MTTDVLIQVEDLQKHFKGGSGQDYPRARRCIRCRFNKGEVVVVIGPSGSAASPRSCAV